LLCTPKGPAILLLSGYGTVPQETVQEWAEKHFSSPATNMLRYQSTANWCLKKYTEKRDGRTDKRNRERKAVRKTNKEGRKK
jgi:hypothetical protein